MRLHYEFETLINLGTSPFFFDSTPQIVKLFGLKYIYSPFVDIGLNFSSLVLMTLSSFLLLDQYWKETSWRPSLPCLHLSSPFHLHTHFFFCKLLAIWVFSWVLCPQVYAQSLTCCTLSKALLRSRVDYV